MERPLLLIALLMFPAVLMAETDNRPEVTDLYGPRVVRGPVPAGFVITRKFLRRGEITEDGRCMFRTHLRLKPGETSIEQVEIAYDPDTCRSLVVQGYQESGRHE